MMASGDAAGPRRVGQDAAYAMRSAAPLNPAAAYGGMAMGMNPPSAAGRSKTDQVVLEFLYKAAELIVQSRVHLQVDSEQGRMNRRARFNLDIEEFQSIRDKMSAWKEDVHLPLTINIAWGQDDEEVQVAETSDNASVLVEQWSVMYVATAPTQHAMAQPTMQRDVIQQLKEVCKKISVLLRAMHSLMRQLPAHRLFRRAYPSNLEYSLHPLLDNTQDRAMLGFDAGVATSRYSFLPIATPFGFLKVSVLYRRNCHALETRRSEPVAFFKENFIIPDYVSPSTTVHDATNERHQDEEAIRARRRSNPSSRKSIDTSTTDTSGSLRSSKRNISSPMAIPQQVKAAPIVSYDQHALSPEESSRAIAYPHSYADPERLRAVNTNPNVQPAPYGYGNVAIEEEPAPSSTSTSIERRGIAGMLQDQLSSPHPLATPPLHPHSGSLSRSSIRPGLSTSAGKKTTNENAYRHSFENFVLDSTNSSPDPSQSPSLTSQKQGQSFQLGGTRGGSDAGDTSSQGQGQEISYGQRGLSTGSPQQTPPFVTDSPLRNRMVLAEGRHSATHQPTVGGAFDSSPPFQVYPPELLSTSPGYALSKQLRHTRHSSLGAPSSGLTLSGNELGISSSAMDEHGANAWGVSPDSPDEFGLAIAGTTRRRLLSAPDREARPTTSAFEDSDYGLDLFLPFALGDGDGTSTATTITTSESESDRPSSLLSMTGDSGARTVTWDTASVGNFLQQLKEAPRLQAFDHSADAHAAALVEQRPSGASVVRSSHDALALYDDELECFRNLHDELIHEL